MHIQSCPPDGFANAIVSARMLLHNAIVSARPYSKLNALGRPNTFAMFYKLRVHFMNDMGNVWPLVIRCNHKIREHSCCIYVGSVHACVQSCTCPRTVFLCSPGHDCICKSVRSGQYLMADTIASDTVCTRLHFPLFDPKNTAKYLIVF